MSRVRLYRGGESRSYVACEVGNSYYALPVEQVQEIIQPMPLTPLPHCPPGVIGAIEHRDTVVPVLDLGHRLGFGSTESPRRKWVLMRALGRTLGLVVAQVHEVLEVNESGLRPAPDVGNVELRGASHVLNYRGTMAFLLDMQIVAKLAELALPLAEAQ